MASWHLLYGSPSPLFCTPCGVVGLVDKVGLEPTTWRFPHSLCSFHHSIRVGLQLSQLSLLIHTPGRLDPTLVRMELNTAPFRSMPLANDDIRFVLVLTEPITRYQNVVLHFSNLSLPTQDNLAASDNRLPACLAFS